MAGSTVRRMSDPWAPTAPGQRAKPRKRSRKALIALCAVVAAVGLGGMAAGVYAFTRDTSIVDQLTGKMTVKGRTRDLVAPATFRQDGALGVFEGSLTLKRADYGIGEGMWATFDTVANEVLVKFKLVALAAKK